MKKYLYETHAHTAETSTCGEKKAKDVIEHYKTMGYDGVVITDHMHTGTFKRLGDNASEQAKTELWLRGYHEAKKYETEDFKVILGMEIRFLDADNDYLVYGFTEDSIHGDELAHIGSLREFRPIVEKNNLIIFQAHPFRHNMKVSDERLLDGIEVYNGHGGHSSNNEIAYEWAKKYDLRMLSGSDYHGGMLMEKGGVYFDRQITTPQELVKALRGNEYELKCFQTIK